MNFKIIAGVFLFLATVVCTAGCLGTSEETAPYELIGTWTAAGNAFGVSYDLKLICNEDGSAKLSGYIGYNGNTYNLNENMAWEYVSGNKYLASSSGKSVSVSLSGDTCTITINPMKLGIADFDISYDLQMARSPTSPTGIVGTWRDTEPGTYDLAMTYRADGTGTISGTVYYNGLSVPVEEGVTWMYVNSNNYQALYGSSTLPLDLYGRMLFVTIIPSTLNPTLSNDPLSVLTTKV